MTTLTDPILTGKKDPSPDVLKEFTITGGSETVEIKLKSHRWNGKDPIATVGVHINNGEVVNSEIFTLGFKEAGRMSLVSVWGDQFSPDDYLKLESVDLALALAAIPELGLSRQILRAH